MSLGEKISEALSSFFENEMDVRFVTPATLTSATEHRPSVFDGPVIMVSERLSGDVDIAIFVDEGDNLSVINADVYKAIHGKTLYSGDDILISFVKANPILDETDFHVGEQLSFSTKRQHSLLAA